MGDLSEEPVLRRKVGARRASMGLAEMTPEKALRLALAKSGDTVLNVPVALRSLTDTEVAADDRPGPLPENGLILALEGPVGATGLVVACGQTVAAAIEAQTLGRVSSGAAPDRTPTGTDASMIRGLVDLTLEGFALLAAECRGLPMIEGFVTGARILDARAAGMFLDDAPHRMLTAELDFASGAKTGSLLLILPKIPPKAALTDQRETGWGAQLEKAVMGSTARLDAQLCRLKIPLSEAVRFEVGQEIPLTGASIDDLTLKALNGKTVASARLGRSGPMRAVRVQTDESAATPPAAMDHTALPAPMGDPAPMPEPALPEPSLPDPGPPAMGLTEPGLAPLDDAAMSLDTTPLDDLPDTLDPSPMTLDLPD